MTSPSLVIGRLQEEGGHYMERKTRGEQLVYIIAYRGQDVLLCDLIESCVFFCILSVYDLILVGASITDPTLFDVMHKAVTCVYSDPAARTDLLGPVVPERMRIDIGRKFDRMFGFDIISHVSLNMTVYNRPMCYIFKRIREDEEEEDASCFTKRMKLCTLV